MLKANSGKAVVSPSRDLVRLGLFQEDRELSPAFCSVKGLGQIVFGFLCNPALTEGCCW